MKPIIATKLSAKIESLPMEQGPRMHLGASEIGEECVRRAWYGFRWASNIKHKNKLLRLFNRGHDEENRFEDILKKAGCEIYTKDLVTGEQFTISDFDGHFGGSLDGIIYAIPYLPNEWCLVEFKTSADKAFKELHGWNSKSKKYDTSLGKGVRSAKPVHYAQMQIYMHYKVLKYALYCVVNKNDDTLHFEIVSYDTACIPALQQKAKNAIYSDEPPPKIDKNPSSFKCLFCPHKGICQLNETPARNCRTCMNVIMLPEGQWKCGLTNKLKDKKGLLNGCDNYQLSGKFS
jgi:hypothetical protein